MRDSQLLVLIVTLLTFNVAAQIKSVKDYPAWFNDSKHLWLEKVENQSSRSIVAVHTTFECPLTPLQDSGRHGKHSETVGGYDALSVPFNIFGAAIPPGGVTELLAEDPSKRCTGGVDLVVFSDGQFEGKSRVLNEYKQMWASLHDGVAQSLPLLVRVASKKAEMAELEDFVRQRMESIPEKDLKRWGERAVYFDLQSMLRSAGEGKAASDSTPDAPPPNENVAASNIPEEQAQKMATYLANRFQEWKTALEDVLQSPP